MSKFIFVKYQETGNDFILIDDRAFFFDTSLVRPLCHRQFGVGADGVVLLQPDSTADFRMRIFNSDGSEAAMCGNGLCCLMQFIVDLGLPKQLTRIATANRIVEVEPCGEKISIQMDPASHVKQLYIEGREVYFLDTGVPHAVVFVPDVKRVDLMNEGNSLRHHCAFQPNGANVNFASLQNDGSICVRTFERGVERETLSCGTGAVAVGIVAAQKYRLPNPMQMCFSGGCLDIHVNHQGVKMVGHVSKVFEGSIQSTLHPVFCS